MEKALFSIGEVVKHKLYDYYGVIYDVDPQFYQSAEWYEAVAESRPKKNSLGIVY